MRSIGYTRMGELISYKNAKILLNYENIALLTNNRVILFYYGESTEWETVAIDVGEWKLTTDGDFEADILGRKIINDDEGKFIIKISNLFYFLDYSDATNRFLFEYNYSNKFKSDETFKPEKLEEFAKKINFPID